MKFGEYVAKLNNFLKENPKAGKFETYSATDPEGNGYYRVNYGPELRMTTEEKPGTYRLESLIQEADIEYMKEEDEEFEYKPNVVLIAP